MITTASRPRTSRRLVIGLVLAILIHLFGGALWGFFARVVAHITPVSPLFASRREPPAAPADIVRLERRIRAAAPARAHENRVVQRRPVAAPLPLPIPAAPAPAHHELAHITIHAPHQSAVANAQAQSDAPPMPVAAPPRKPAFSDDQIAQLGAQFAKTIADSHQDAASVTAQAQTAPATVKHYAMHYNGIHEGMNPGDGEITWIKRDRIGETMRYYTHYTYMYGDGHVEDDDIPWPFFYPITNDPFARHDKRIAIQAPPEKYQPNRPLKPFLMQFFGGAEVQ